VLGLDDVLRLDLLAAPEEAALLLDDLFFHRLGLVRELGLGCRDDAPCLVLGDLGLLGVLDELRFRRLLDLVLSDCLGDVRLAAAEESALLRLLDGLGLGLEIDIDGLVGDEGVRIVLEDDLGLVGGVDGVDLDELDRALDLVGRQRDLGLLRDLGGAPGGLVRGREVRVRRALHVRIRVARRNGTGVRAVDEAVFPEGHGS
jgi:hypothetical protein